MKGRENSSCYRLLQIVEKLKKQITYVFNVICLDMIDNFSIYDYIFCLKLYLLAFQMVQYLVESLIHTYCTNRPP